MIKHIKSVGVLVAICSVMAVLLALTNQITAPIIEKNAAAAASGALLELMPAGKGFEQVSIEKLPATVTEAYKETSGMGYVIKLSVTGYGPDMVIMCGVTTDGKVTGAKCLSSNETLSKEKEYGKNFTGKDAAGVDAVETIGGATMTTAAYKSAVKDALTSALVLGGADVDVRTPEQILADNLAAALPAAEGKFTKVFFTEIVEGIDAMYVADNGTGYVAIIGEEFIAADAEGNSDNAVVATAAKAMIASTSTDVDMTAYEGINENITSIKKTATGNYIIEINGLGFGWFGNSEHYQDPKYIPIVIRVSLSPDAKIIDTLTVSHQETNGYGAGWGTEEYYGQFDGTTIDDYKNVDVISGATISNNGYLKAIERCFLAVEILEGGAK
jgi:electron transport complex protein RnfG